MKIRKGNKNDILKVSRLWLSMAKELAPQSTPNIQWWRTLETDLFKSGLYGMYLAEEGGKVIGFLDFLVTCEPLTGEKHLIGRHMYIDPEHRKSSIAMKLYSASMKNGKESGATVFDLICDKNEKAFWEKKGYRETSYVMRKQGGMKWAQPGQ